MITLDMDVGKITAKLKKYVDILQPILDTQVLKDSNYYAPMDTGNLMSSGITGSKIGSGQLLWTAPYAKKMYYGVGYNFSKDSNPNARAKWFEEAKAKKMKEWEKILNANS